MLSKTILTTDEKAAYLQDICSKFDCTITDIKPASINPNIMQHSVRVSVHGLEESVRELLNQIEEE